jgi:hypothetical protein
VLRTGLRVLTVDEVFHRTCLTARDEFLHDATNLYPSPTPRSNLAARFAGVQLYMSLCGLELHDRWTIASGNVLQDGIEIGLVQQRVCRRRRIGRKTDGEMRGRIRGREGEVCTTAQCVGGGKVFCPRAGVVRLWGWRDCRSARVFEGFGAEFMSCPPRLDPVAHRSSQES